MNIVKCANGHFFDSETYKLCPHCGAPVGAASTAPGPAPGIPSKKEKKGLFGFGGKKTKDKNTMQPGWNVPQNGSGPQGQYGGYVENYGPVTGGVYPNPQVVTGPRTEDVPVQFNQPQSVVTPTADTMKTLDFWQTASGGTVKQPEPVAPEVPVNVPVSDPPVSVPGPEPVQPAPAPEPAPAPAPKPENSLLNEVRQASASDEGKTLSYFSAVTGAAGSAASAPAAPGAPAQSAAPKAIDPVVGWLVSVEGPHFGESFSIHSGMNSIGRNPSNRIVLDRDMAVSREKHAFITYEPKHRRFYVKPGDSSGLVYVNEDYITENRQINPRDVLEIGSSKLVFLPFCTEEFGWEDVLNK